MGRPGTLQRAGAGHLSQPEWNGQRSRETADPGNWVAALGLPIRIGGP